MENKIAKTLRPRREAGFFFENNKTPEPDLQAPQAKILIILKGKTVFFQWFLAPQAKFFGRIYGDFFSQKNKTCRKKMIDFENNKTPERKILGIFPYPIQGGLVAK